MATSHAAAAIYDYAISRIFSADARETSAAVRALRRFTSIGQLARHVSPEYEAQVGKAAR